MKKNKLLRRLNHLLRLNLFPIERIVHSDTVNIQYWPRRNSISAWLEVLDIISKLQMPISEVIDLGIELRLERLSYRREYRKRPVVQRKDNKDRTVGSRGSNRNKIRYPKKVRKTAWKRFYKLFPHLNPKNNEKDFLQVQ